MQPLNCQDFSGGCCGCCVNMRWSRRRLERFLAANTAVTESVRKRRNGELRLRDLVGIHLRRGGWADYALAFILVPLTLGVSVLVWKRLCGSCCFAGFLDESQTRTGCLIHPLRLGGGGDLRKHAFPLVPTLNCDRDLRCPQLESPGTDGNRGWHETSLAGARTLHR